MLRTEYVGSSTSNAQGSETLQCIICLDTRNLREHETVSCGHIFHKVCILRWLQNANSCPTCRMPVKRVLGLHSSLRHDLQHQFIPDYPRFIYEPASSHQEVQQLQLFGQIETPREQPVIPSQESEEQEVFQSFYVFPLQVMEQSVTRVQQPLARPDQEHRQELSLEEQLQLHQQVIEDMLQASHEQSQEQRQMQEELKFRLLVERELLQEEQRCHHEDQRKLHEEQYDLQVERELLQEEQRHHREDQRKLHEEQRKLQEDRQLFQEERRKHQEERRKFLEERTKYYRRRTIKSPGRVKIMHSRAWKNS